MRILNRGSRTDHGFDEHIAAPKRALGDEFPGSRGWRTVSGCARRTPAGFRNLHPTSGYRTRPIDSVHP